LPISDWFKTKQVFDVDRYDDVHLCLKAIPVLKHIAHAMLKNDLKSRQLANQKSLASSI
jgi:predicted phosphoadenosine phosphosulfate sulfurtransferase